jgi:septum formation protein
MHGLWQGGAPLILASTSAARQALLTAAGIPFEAIASGLDERAFEAPLIKAGASAAKIAAHLAEAKARAIARVQPGRLVLGADQTLDFEGRILSKPATMAEAHDQLMRFSGKTHELYSALCVLHDDKILFETVERACLTCRAFGADFVTRYLKAAGEMVRASVGGYQIEGLGIHLFERVEGDHATILGLPLLPLLAFLRQEGCLV